MLSKTQADNLRITYTVTTKTQTSAVYGLEVTISIAVWELAVILIYWDLKAARVATSTYIQLSD